MAGGCIDIYQSRRTEHDKCYYWKIDEEDLDLEEYTHNNKYDGRFYAKEISPRMLQKLVYKVICR